MAAAWQLQFREFGDMSSSNDTRRHPKHEHTHEGERHGEASSGEHGHSGEGAASVLAHLIQQDQKQRRESGDAEEDATLA